MNALKFSSYVYFRIFIVQTRNNLAKKWNTKPVTKKTHIKLHTKKK